MATAQQVVRVAAIGDVHCTKTSQGTLQSLFQQINERFDIFTRPQDCERVLEVFSATGY